MVKVFKVILLLTLFPLFLWSGHKLYYYHPELIGRWLRSVAVVPAIYFAYRFVEWLIAQVVRMLKAAVSATSEYWPVAIYAGGSGSRRTPSCSRSPYRSRSCTTIPISTSPATCW